MKKKKTKSADLIIRPAAPEEKIHYREDFELCYLRHQYFRKVDYNPTQQEMEPYQKIAAKLASNTFFTYRPLLRIIGLEKEDLVNIANVHLVSYLGLFSLEQVPKKYTDFVRVFKQYANHKPKKEDILDRNKSHFTLFLKQRMEELVRICRQKAKNIKGFSVDGFNYYCGSNLPPRPLKELIKNYERLGFRKLDAAVFKSIKRRAKVFDDSIFLMGNNYYIAVPIPKKSLTVEDFNGADMGPRDTLHNMSPEELYFTLEDKNIWDKRQQDFDNKPVRSKVWTLKRFIKNNKSNRSYRQEIRAAREILEGLKVKEPE